MRTLLRTTPLFALDAVVLDTETTGLDPRTARLVEIGAVALSGGRLAEEERFQSLVALDEPVPTAVLAREDESARNRVARRGEMVRLPA